jgi:hypothetical protein
LPSTPWGGLDPLGEEGGEGSTDRKNKNPSVSKTLRSYMSGMLSKNLLDCALLESHMEEDRGGG